MKRNMLMAMVMIVIVGAGISWSVAQTTQPAKKADKAKAKAPTEAYKIDNVHSSVVFKVGHLGVSSVYGRFNEAAGQFHHNAADPSQCKFVVTVKADSLDTNNKKRDEHVLGPDFLNAKEHKEIKFESTAVKKGKRRTN